MTISRSWSSDLTFPSRLNIATKRGLTQGCEHTNLLAPMALIPWVGNNTLIVV